MSARRKTARGSRALALAAVVVAAVVAGACSSADDGSTPDGGPAATSTRECGTTVDAERFADSDELRALALAVERVRAALTGQ